MLSDEALLRYSRQIMLPELDIAGQEAILAGRVLVVGLGGLGSPVAMYLAAAGVGELILVDGDQVDLHNLQRQIVHDSASIGVDKVRSAAERLRALNPLTRLDSIARYVDEDGLTALVARADVVVDCSDNFRTRHALNRACVVSGKPLVSGAAIRFEGQVAVFNAGPEAPCYACLYGLGDADEAETCSENGVLAPLVGVIGSLQAMETLKLLTGVGTTLSGRVLVYDGLAAGFRELRLKRDPACPVCAAR